MIVGNGLVAARLHGPCIHHRERTSGLRAPPRQDGPIRSWRLVGLPQFQSRFDEYRTETLKRMEDEQREFRDFLARLRQAKDKAEFDQFMAERRNRPSDQTSQQG